MGAVVDFVRVRREYGLVVNLTSGAVGRLGDDGGGS